MTPKTPGSAAARVRAETAPDLAIAAAAESLATYLRAAHVEMLYERNLIPGLMGLPFGLLLVTAFWAPLPHLPLLLWYLLKTVAIIARVLLSHAYRRRAASDPVETWERRYVVMLFADGLCWTLLGLWFARPDQVVVMAAMICSLLGVGAVATVSLSTHRLGAAAFGTTLLLPTAVGLLIEGSREGLFTGGAMIVFYVLMLDYGRRAAAATEELLRLRFEIGQARDQALAAARAKTDFLATMSHELRTPLNAVLGMATLLETGDLSAAQRQRVNVIKTSGEALLSLIGDILGFSKIDSGRIDLEIVPVPVVRFLEDTLQVVALAAAEKHLDLRYELTGEVPEVVLTDPTRLRQVLLNLLSNAVKFTSAGGIVVRVSPGTGADGKRWLELAVTDTGIGIGREALEKLFAPFSQADASIVRRFGGSGLGLAISRRLCAALGGEITVESTPGVGSTFRFRVAAEPAAGESSRWPQHASARTERPPTPETRALTVADRPVVVLVVDDNAVNRLVTLEQLRWLGYEATAVESGAEALEHVRSTHVDVVLMDLQMPELDGDETTRRLFQTFEGRPHPAVIGLTASALAEDRERCLAAGMIDYLVKPVGLEALEAALAGSRPHWPPRPPAG